MPSNQTQNYQLNQWIKSDRVLMDDFNEDNRKIDAAIKAVDNRLTTVAGGKASSAELESLKSGKADVSALEALKSRVSTLEGAALQAKFGTYTGNGTSGESNARTLTFDRLPVLLIIRKSGSFEGIIAPRGLTRTTPNMASTGTGSSTTLSWDSGKNQVSWYGDAAKSHLNENNYTYYYVAIF